MTIVRKPIHCDCSVFIHPDIVEQGTNGKHIPRSCRHEDGAEQNLIVYAYQWLSMHVTAQLCHLNLCSAHAALILCRINAICSAAVLWPSVRTPYPDSHLPSRLQRNKLHLFFCRLWHSGVSIQDVAPNVAPIHEVFGLNILPPSACWCFLRPCSLH